MANGNDDHDFEKWYRELQSMVAQNDPEDLEHVEQILREADAQAKMIVRKQMGLS